MDSCRKHVHVHHCTTTNLASLRQHQRKTGLSDLCSLRFPYEYGWSTDSLAWQKKEDVIFTPLPFNLKKICPGCEKSKITITVNLKKFKPVCSQLRVPQLQFLLKHFLTIHLKCPVFLLSLSHSIPSSHPKLFLFHSSSPPNFLSFNQEDTFLNHALSYSKSTPTQESCINVPLI